eukprot:2499918-Ditylum_brightwellii.AAC.1
MTMINPGSSLVKTALVPVYQYNDPKKKESEMCTDMMSAQIIQLFNNNWLSCYPCPQYVVYDNGSKFKLHFKSLFNQHGLEHKPTSKEKPQANAILERIHQNVANMLRSFDLDNQQF